MIIHRHDGTLYNCLKNEILILKEVLCYVKKQIAKQYLWYNDKKEKEKGNNNTICVSRCREEKSGQYTPKY